MRAVAERLRALAERKGSWLYALGLAALLIAFFWPAATLRGVFYVGDIYRLGYPARQLYAQALRQGRIPLWTPDALLGYPILAEGQTGSFYPPNLLLYRLLPLPVALNLSVLVAFWIAGLGTFAYVRSLGLRREAAFLAGCVFMLGGFLPGHLNHLNMLAGVAWLPLLLWAVERATRRGGPRAWVLVAALFGLQGLAGHPQVSLMSGLVAGAQALAGPLHEGGRGLSLRRQMGQAAACAAALAVGGALALVQWAPTLELTRLSQRGQGLSGEFFTSFSLHPLQWFTMLSPFARGNPYPLTSLETIGYVGVLPLALAALAPLARRDRRVLFWSGVAVLGLLLTMGKWNLAYHLLQYVPLMNMFRAPARYLLWVDLAIAILAAATVDSLLLRCAEAPRRPLGSAGGLAVAGLAGLAVGRSSLDGLVASWRWLPLLWLGAAAALLLGWRLRPAQGWYGLAVGLLLADLAAFNGVYNRTYNELMPPAGFEQAPQVLSFLESDAQGAIYRVYTVEEIAPVLPVMRESLYPNIQLLHGVSSLNGYYPLVPGAQQWLLEHLSPRLLDLVNVRYVLIPQLLPVDEETEFYDTEDPFAPSIVGRSFDLGGLAVAALEVEGYLSHSAELADGTPVAEIVLRSPGGQETVWTLRAGQELAEWARARDDVQPLVRHRVPTVARTWPACSGFPPRQHPGQTYLARHTLTQPVQAQGLAVRPLIPRAYVRLERLRLVDPAGRARLLSSLVGEGDHVLVYRSPEVAIYRNEGAGPRAILVHRARVVASEEEARQVLTQPGFDPRAEVVLVGGEELVGEPSDQDSLRIEAYAPEYVRVRARTQSPAYLVLADSHYPGWVARLDGRPATVRQADVALRAVALPAGEHVVEFAFAPASLRWGLAVSLAGWAAVAAVALARLDGSGHSAV